MRISKISVYIFVTIFVWQFKNNLCAINDSHKNRLHRLKSSYSRTTVDIKEKIIEWQCYAKCSPSKGYLNFENCKTQCKVDTMKTPRAGQCARQSLITTSTSENVLLQQLACMDECSIDFDCPETKKCCPSACGPVCLNPIGIRENELLPPIPEIVHRRFLKGHKVEITMQTSANSSIYYHVETRHHIGHTLSLRKMSSWHWQPVEMTAEETLENKQKRIQICFNLKPGRWYQVRIAAINANGFRGYSEPSTPFKLHKNPRPPMAPADLQVTGASFNGHFCTANIVWCPSKSNLPIEKYKIIWSLYVKSKEESIISNESFVKDTHQFLITRLLPESSYYIQVLAISISGSRRLKSDKKSILFNTTTTTLALQGKTLKCFHSHQNEKYHDNNSNNNNNLVKHKPVVAHQIHKYANSSNRNATILPYDVRFHLNRKFGMIVQISGFQPNKEKVYELCPTETNCEQREYSAIRAKKNSLEFSRLKYNTTYFLKTIQPGTPTEIFNKEQTSEKTTFTFRTPKCENFKKRFLKIQIQC